MISPTLVPLPTPASMNAAARSVCAEVEFAVAEPAVGIDHHRLVRVLRPSGAAPVRRSVSSIEQPLHVPHVDLAAGQQGHPRAAARRRTLRESCRRTSSRRELRVEAPASSSSASSSTAMTATTDLATIRVGDAEHVRHGAAGDLRDRLLDLGGRDVGAGRLDHRAAAAEVVEEPVVVGGTRSPVWNQPSASKHSSRLRV